ncbi:MAG: hypothetical protein IJP80_04055 [Bacteroidales bacterium]|nr:hypothetical protein [Bacteroidales bacterium]
MDVLPCDCEGTASGRSDSEVENISAEIKALFQEWIDNRECTLKTKEIADKLIPLMEACGSLFSASAIEVQAPLELRSYWLFFTSASSSSP